MSPTSVDGGGGSLAITFFSQRCSLFICFCFFFFFGGVCVLGGEVVSFYPRHVCIRLKSEVVPQGLLREMTSAASFPTSFLQEETPFSC